jgi:chromosome partitioning protein
LDSLIFSGKIKFLEPSKKSLNKNLAIEGYVMTMYDPRLNLSKQVVNEAKKYFGDLVFETVIPRNVRLSEAPSFGKPIILYDVMSTGAKSYMNLAKEVINRGKNKK